MKLWMKSKSFNSTHYTSEIIGVPNFLQRPLKAQIFDPWTIILSPLKTTFRGKFRISKNMDKTKYLWYDGPKLKYGSQYAIPKSLLLSGKIMCWRLNWSNHHTIDNMIVEPEPKSFPLYFARTLHEQDQQDSLSYRNILLFKNNCLSCGMSQCLCSPARSNNIKYMGGG